jgi:hypothetical protein
MSAERVRVWVDGQDLGTVNTAKVGPSDGEESGILVNTEIKLVDPSMALEKAMLQETQHGKNSLLLTLEFPDGRKFNGSHVGVKEIVSGSSLTFLAGRGGWTA